MSFLFHILIGFLVAALLSAWKPQLFQSIVMWLVEKVAAIVRWAAGLAGSKSKTGK